MASRALRTAVADPVVRADLAAPRWKLKQSGILIEDKIEIRKRIGRSPDVGDAIVMAWHVGEGAPRDQVVGRRRSNANKVRPTHYAVSERHARVRDRHRRGSNGSGYGSNSY
jgi:hypothetical protein